MWRVHETDFFSFEESMVLESFFSWSEGSGYRPWNFLHEMESNDAFEIFGFPLENGIKWCFLKSFLVDCMFCLILLLIVYFGGVFCHQSPGIEGLWLRSFFFIKRDKCLIKRVRRSPRFLKRKTFYYENEESVFSTLSKMTIFRGFFSLVTSKIKGTENSTVLVQIPRNNSIKVF